MDTRTCTRCSAAMERGFTTARGLIGGDGIDSDKAQLLFVVPTTPTSSNPIEAFRQGRDEGPAHRCYGIVGWRCTGCGALEFATSDAVHG